MYFPDASPPSSGAGHIIDVLPRSSPPSSGVGHIIDALPRCKSSKQWCRPHNRCTSQMQVLQAVVQATTHLGFHDWCLHSHSCSWSEIDPHQWASAVAFISCKWTSVLHQWLQEKNGRKEMFYLTMHSTHFILWLSSLRHMVTDDTDSKRLETRCHHIGYSFWLAARVLLYASSHRQDNTSTAFVSQVVEHWLQWEIAQCVHWLQEKAQRLHIIILDM